ncbi:MAG: NADH-quinone oxidoreductase subunit L [Zavarzinella sp.]
MFEPSYLLGYVVLLPLLGAVLTALFGGVKELARFSHYPALIGAALAAICAILVAGKIADAPEQAIELSLGTWFQVEMGTSAKFSVPATLRADSLTGIMICVISFIGTWIVLFSTSYMKGETGYTRYFAVVSLFISSMLLLVTADNFLLMFAGWEGVGACSYLLVGFWYAKPAAASAARKAFLVTRLGDVGLIMGIFLFWYMGDRTTIVFNDLFATAEKMATTFPTMFPVACLLTLCGALGKSAQFPLYVWLPDAMEGPTPVSALIHAATMVTAGVYLLARCSALFILAPQIQILIAVLGGITAILAAFIALTQHDLKRVLAYSTVSQLGFMFLALGCSGAVSPTMAVLAAIFHLFTHAFFKAVLFLSAGSVMHSMHHVIDMRQFSGLRKVLPITHWTFLAGAAALAGLPLLSGFWSKDLILEAAHKAGESNAVYAGEYNLLYYGALLTAFMTAFYTFRAYFRTFWGAEKMPEAPTLTNHGQ